ncbi:hypothetical protein BGZ51_004732 [Haplosporangium sp. Z 767]|nr:hypothetical protein BGZ51_004732 [Haplosporangium sp. Z 767]
MFGKLFHYAADAILLSAVLAGIKRSTGLTVASNRIESKDVRSAVDRYLNIGEWVMDQGIMLMSTSKYFERKRRALIGGMYNVLERALNKSLRSSVRGVEHPVSTLPFSQSVRGFHPREPNSGKRAFSAEGMRHRTLETDNSVKDSNTRRIIQHFDALSKDNTQNRTSLGVRRYGAVSHRIEKKLAPTLPKAGYSSVLQKSRGHISVGTSEQDILGIKVASDALYSINNEKESLNVKEGPELLPWSTKPSNLRTLDFIGKASVRQDRHLTASGGKRQEELYLAQARLLQWYMMTRKVAQQFMDQEQSAEAQFESVGRTLLIKQAGLLQFQERFKIEQELIELESTLELQRDQLLAIVMGVESLKDRFSEFVTALDQETRVLNIPGIEVSNLEFWLNEVQDCRKVVDMSLRRIFKDQKLVHGLARIMQALCDNVESEIRELKECAVLLSGLREMTCTESSLLASNIIR